MSDLSDEERAAWRKERRRAFRRFHPDVGGTAEELNAALARIDARYDRSEGSPGERIYIFSTKGPLGYLQGLALIAWRYVQRIPKRRTYFDI